MAGKIYVATNSKLTAVQWNGSNLNEIKDFLGDKLYIDDNFLPLDCGESLLDLYLKDRNGMYKINLMDYIVEYKHPQHVYVPVDNVVFELMYKRRR